MKHGLPEVLFDVALLCQPAKKLVVRRSGTKFLVGPGRAGRVESDMKRHSMQLLIAPLNCANGLLRGMMRNAEKSASGLLFVGTASTR